MSEKQATNIHTMRQLQHRAELLNWIAEMPSPWKPWAIIKWRSRMPKLSRRDKAPVTKPEGVSDA